jgi:hypothetical protein
MDHSASRIDGFDPDYTRDCAAFRNASCLEAHLDEGQAIYYPSPWWVQTQAERSGAGHTPAIAASVSILTREGAPLVAKRLRDACAARVETPWDDEWGLDDEGAGALCDAITPCLDEWEALPHPPPLDMALQRKALFEWIGRHMPDYGGIPTKKKGATKAASRPSPTEL